MIGMLTCEERDCGGVRSVVIEDHCTGTNAVNHASRKDAILQHFQGIAIQTVGMSATAEPQGRAMS
jgi:hypothetical protein